MKTVKEIHKGYQTRTTIFIMLSIPIAIGGYILNNNFILGYGIASLIVAFSLYPSPKDCR